MTWIQQPDLASFVLLLQRTVMLFAWLLLLLVGLCGVALLWELLLWILRLGL